MATKALLRQFLYFGTLRGSFELLQILHDLLLARLGIETDLEGHVVGLGHLGGDICKGKFLFLVPDTGILHGLVEETLVDGDPSIVEVFLMTEDLTVTEVRHRLVVAGSGENVADCELTSVPLGLVFRDVDVDIGKVLSTFLQRVAGVFENDAFNRAMVDLFELVCTVGL